MPEINFEFRQDVEWDTNTMRWVGRNQRFWVTRDGAVLSIQDALHALASSERADFRDFAGTYHRQQPPLPYAEEGI